MFYGSTALQIYSSTIIQIYSSTALQPYILAAINCMNMFLRSNVALCKRVGPKVTYRTFVSYVELHKVSRFPDAKVIIARRLCSGYYIYVAPSTSAKIMMSSKHLENADI